MQQRDIARFVIKRVTPDQVGIATQGGQWAINQYQARDVLADSQMFTDLVKVFDQFKVNAIKVRVVPIDFDSVAGANLQTCVAWDRNAATNAALTYSKLCTYGSAKLNYYSGGARTVQSHFLAAETIGEKTCYLPTETPRVTGNNLFDPYFLIGIAGPAELGEGQEYRLNYAIEWSFDVTFRGTRQS